MKATSPLPPGSAETVRQSLTHILRALEVAAGDRFLASILLLDDDRTTLRCYVAPSLPDEYCKAIDGAQIGPRAGSCGTAAYSGHAIYVTDIATDPTWVDYKTIALKHDLKACWSTPVRDGENRVIATFAVYHRECRAPTDGEREAIRLASAAFAPLLENALAAMPETGQV